MTILQKDITKRVASIRDEAVELDLLINETPQSDKPHNGGSSVDSLVPLVAAIAFGIGTIPAADESSRIVFAAGAIVLAFLAGALFCDSRFNGWYMSKTPPRGTDRAALESKG